MGDLRFAPCYEEVLDAPDRTAVIGALSDEQVIAALADASRHNDPYLANVLATEAQNRAREKETIISTAGEGVYAVDAKGRVTFLNPAAERLLGWTLEEVRGEDAHDAIHCRLPDGEPYPRHACRIHEALRMGKMTWAEDDLFTCKDGRLLPVAYTASPVLTDGEVEGAVVVFRDVTERKRADEALKRFKILSDHANDAIHMVDTQGRIRYVNRLACEQLGYAEAELLQMRVPDIDPVFDPRRYEALFQEVIRGRVSPFETIHRRKDGSTFPVEISVAILEMEGEPRMLAIVRDITERKSAEAELQESESRTRAVLEATLGGRGARERPVEPQGAAALAQKRPWWRRFLGDINAEYQEAMGYETVDRFVVNVLGLHLAALGILVYLNAVLGIARFDPTPFGWRVIPDGEAAVTLLVGLAALAAPPLTHGRLRSHYHWRVLTTVSLVTFSYLYVFITGGSIEAHFHFFMVLAFIVVWADWRLGWIVLALTFSHHAILDVLRPGWVYFYGAERVASIAHAIPVLATAIFTSVICESHRKDVRALECAREVLVDEVAERKRAAEALRGSRERARRIFERSHDAIFIVDAHGDEIVEANPKAFALVGYTPDEPPTPSKLHEDEMPEFVSFVEGVLDRGHGWSSELTCKHKRGHRIPAEISASAIEVDGRRCMLAIVRDTTNRKRAKQEMQQSKADLERRVQERTRQLTAANRELEAFSYRISHDLRAPLRGIDFFSKVLEEDYAEFLHEEGRGCLERVRSESQRLTQLVNDVLALSRASDGDLHRARVNLSALAHTVVGDLQRSAPDRQVGFEIEDGLTAEGDARLLRAALENLLGNAWKFTGNVKSPRIEFGAAQVESERAFFVRDNGAGFDPEQADRLFDAFHRLHTSAEFEGTGIGLATVKRIVERHGGRVWAEGTADEGATFWFTLPPAPGSGMTDHPDWGDFATLGPDNAGYRPNRNATPRPT